MKKLFFAVLVTVSASFAAATTDLRISRPLFVKAQGTVQLHQEVLATCMAIGCPPSRVEVTAFFVNEETGEEVNFQGVYELAQIPQGFPVNVTGKTVHLNDGDLVQLEGYQIGNQFVSVKKLVFLSEEGSSVLLEITEVSKAIGGGGKSITITEDGQVVLTLFNASARTKSSELIAVLSTKEVKKLALLLEQASEGEMVALNLPTCRAIPIATVTTTGLNGSVEISKFGTPCGARHMNNTAAGKTLADYAFELWKLHQGR